MLTHHNGFELDGTKPNRLYNEVMSAFHGVKPPAYWYWGHKHAGAVYKPLNGDYLPLHGSRGAAVGFLFGTRWQ